jgi:hypothetical protein
VLPVDDRPAIQRFACLQNFAITLSSNRGQIEAEHAGERHLTMRRARLAMPIHQLGATNSSPPRGPP